MVASAFLATHWLAPPGWDEGQRDSTMLDRVMTHALCELPLKLEEVLKVVVAPLDGSLCPGDLETAGDGVGALAGAVPVGPAQPLSLERSTLGLRTDVCVGGSTVSLSECVATSDEGDTV